METVTVREACLLVVDCPHSTPEWTDSGALVFRSPNIRSGRLDLSTRSFTTEDGYKERVRRAEPTPGDLIITREAPMGEVAMIPRGIRGCLGQRMVLLRPNPRVIDARFMLYALLSPSVQDEIRTHEGTGSTVSNLRIPALKGLELPLPPLKTQVAIACLLGALDDKIELNSRMDRTLENLASSLFKSWFVDFDPVEAKRDRRKLVGVPHGAEALFPMHFDDTEARPIPKGWQLTRLADCGRWLSGGTPSKQEPKYWGGDIPWISAKSLHTFFLEDSEDRVTPAGAANGTRLVPKGSVLFLVRGMSLADEFRFGIAARELAFNQDAKAIIPRDDINGILLSLFLRHETDTVLGLVDEASHGTKRLQTELVEDLKLALPPAALRSALTAPLTALADRQLGNQRESRTLRVLRDTLLGPLLTGEISIKKAEKAVAEVA
jgi:type I restriction enzyme S subunit